MSIGHQIGNTVITPFVFCIISIVQLVCACSIRIIKNINPNCTSQQNTLCKKLTNKIYECAYSPLNLFLEMFSRMKIFYFGDKMPPHSSGKKCIIICNHPGLFDSMCLINFCQLVGRMDTQLCSFVYYTFKYSPTGQLLQSGGSKFIGENKIKDEKIIREASQMLVDGHYKTVCIFPEGGVLTQKWLDKTNNYAAKFDYPPMQNCCYPRIQGLAWIFEEISYKDAQNIDLYDITLGYEGVDKRRLCDVNIKHEDMNIHIHSKCHKLSDLYDIFYEKNKIHYDKLQLWLWDAFLWKNKILHNFKFSTDTAGILVPGSEQVLLENKTNLNIRYITILIALCYIFSKFIK